MYDILLLSLPEMDKDKPSPGPAYLKGFLQPEFKVKVVDGNQIGDINRILLTVDQYEFKWLGISVFSYEQADLALEIGSNYENVVYGGAGVHQFWPADHFIVGEGEYALRDFLRGNEYKNFCQIDDLNKLPIPDYTDQLNDNINELVMTGSRGCVRNCTFCDVASIWPKYRWVDGKKLADNMHAVCEQTGIYKISFSDSLVNGSMKHFRELVKELAARPKKIRWNGQFIARRRNSFSQDDFDNLLNSGCTGLTIGIESGSESVRNHMGKKFDNNDLDYFITNLGERGIKMKFLLIAGYPTETESDFKETIEMLHRYKKYSAKVEVSPHMMLVDKNTPLDHHHRDLYDKFGFEWKNENSDYKERYKRFIEIFKVGQELGYGFKQHALDKIEKFA